MCSQNGKSIMNDIKLYPRCHPEWVNESPIEKHVQKRGLFINASGYLLPCCWCEHTNNYDDFKDRGFFDKELHVDNVSGIKQILLSKQWITFHKTLVDNPEQAPAICKHSCSKKSLEDEREFNRDE